MEQKITEILNDLYALDPAFKAHEQKLRGVISSLISSKPDTKFDATFAARLRADLMTSGISSKPVESPYTPISIFSFASFRYGILGATLAILLVVPLTYYATIKTNQPSQFALKNVSSGLSQKQLINDKGTNAFGPIALAPTKTSGEVAPKQNSATDAQSVPETRTMAVAAPTAPTQSSPVQSESSSSAPVSMMAGGSAKMGRALSSVMPVNLESIKYVYDGAPLKLTEAKGTVLKRVKGIQASNTLIDLIQKADFSLVDISSYKNTTLRNLEVAEKESDGYSVNINFVEGIVTINSLSTATITPQEYKPIKAKEAPSDEKIISVANEFLKDHGITTDIYGKPVVENPTYLGYDASNKPTEYIQDYAVVTYPLVIKDNFVYEQGGYRYGMQVSVDIRNNKVSGVSNLTSQVYESSSYDLEQDPTHILDAATQPQNFGNARVKTVKLGTPQQVYLRYWSYTTGNGVGDELYVPALLFPVKNPTTKYEAQNIIVPLVKNFVITNDRPVPVAVPMPVEIDGGNGASSNAR